MLFERTCSWCLLCSEEISLLCDTRCGEVRLRLLEHLQVFFCLTRQKANTVALASQCCQRWFVVVVADLKIQRVNAVWMQHSFHTRTDERRKIVMSTRMGEEAKLHGSAITTEYVVSDTCQRSTWRVVWLSSGSVPLETVSDTLLWHRVTSRGLQAGLLKSVCTSGVVCATWQKDWGLHKTQLRSTDTSRTRFKTENTLNTVRTAS